MIDDMTDVVIYAGLGIMVVIALTLSLNYAGFLPGTDNHQDRLWCERNDMRYASPGECWKDYYLVSGSRASERYEIPTLKVSGIRESMRGRFE